MVRPPNMLSLPQVQFFALLVRAYNAYSAQADSRTQIKSMTGKRIVLPSFQSWPSLGTASRGN